MPNWHKHCGCRIGEACDHEPGLSSSPALERQEGGQHYKGMVIQPVEYIVKNDLGFIEGNVVKYVSRWRAKGGVEDLKKARHFLDMLIEFELDKKP